MAVPEPTDNSPSSSTPLDEIDGIGRARSSKLADSGYEIAKDLRDKDPLAVSEETGISAAVLTDVIAKVSLSGQEKMSSIAEARSEAQRHRNAKAVMVKTADGDQKPVVLKEERVIHEPGVTATVRKG